MREVELKSVVDDIGTRRAIVERAGGRLAFEGTLKDVRYDSAAGDLVQRDHVLRVRVYGQGGRHDGYLDWKGATRYEAGYKVREELSTPASDSVALSAMLRNLGFVVVKEIEREIAQYELSGAIIRFERYPRMDPLVEVEGPPDAIENAIEIIGLPRAGFTVGRLAEFVASYELRTGERAALTARELGGDHDYRNEDA
ncbi:MAG: CYTH domain-containing protein [Gemmatimonadaceae bacterium]